MNACSTAHGLRYLSPALRYLRANGGTWDLVSPPTAGPATGLDCSQETKAVDSSPFGLSLSFDKLRMIGPSWRTAAGPFDKLRGQLNPFGLSLSKPFDKLRANGVGATFFGNA